MLFSYTYIASTEEKKSQQRYLKSEQSVFSLKSSVAKKKGATSVCHEGDPLKQEMGLFLVSVALRLFVG